MPPEVPTRVEGDHLQRLDPPGPSPGLAPAFLFRPHLHNRWYSYEPARTEQALDFPEQEVQQLLWKEAIEEVQDQSSGRLLPFALGP